MCLSPVASGLLPANAGRTAGHMDIPVEDWDAMFRAVLERLRQAAGEILVTAPVLQGPDPATLLQTIVLECVGALEQLHTALKHDRTCSK